MAGMEKTMILRRNWLSRFGAEEDGCPKQSQCFLPGAWEKADADSGRAVWGLGGGRNQSGREAMSTTNAGERLITPTECSAGHTHIHHLVSSHSLFTWDSMTKMLAPV